MTSRDHPAGALEDDAAAAAWRHRSLAATRHVGLPWAERASAPIGELFVFGVIEAPARWVLVRLVDDRMDDHYGVDEGGTQLAADERRTVAGSVWLREELRSVQAELQLLRHGGDPQLFVPMDPGTEASPPVIACFGAMAGWSGVELVTRWRAMAAVSRSLVSVVIVTWNAADPSRQCLSSVLDDPPSPRCEMVVLYNTSTDGTAAGNEGLANARGDLLAILNSDVAVTPGRTPTVAHRLPEDRSIALLGPVTDNINKETWIVIGYGRDCEAKYTQQTVCTGWRVVWAEDAFVSHELSAQLDGVGHAVRQELSACNRADYERKWGARQPNVYREADA